MGETAIQKEILHRLIGMEKMIGYIMDYIEDSKLSDDDRKALKMALKEGKEGRLLSKKQVFG